MNFEPILYGPLFIRDAQDINLVAASADPVDLTVSVGGSSWTIPVTPVLTNNRYLAALRMREILSSVVGIPGLANAGEREVPLVTLSAGDATMSVRAVYGAASGKTPTQLAGHWLSWRDQVSTTHAWGRERLTFLAGLDLLGWQSGTYSVKAKIFLSSGDPVTVTLTSGTLQSGCRYVTVDASYATIAAAVSASVRSKIRAWDVSYSFSGTDSQRAAATINGYPLRLIIARDEVRVKEFVFCNSFGVEDRVYSSGRSNPKLDGSSVAFLSGASEYELRNDSTEGREVYSGRLGSARESALWLDFLKAHDRYILASGGLARIIVDSQETDLQDNALGSVKFTYHLGALDNGRYFNDQEGLGDYDPTQRHGALYIGDEPPSEELPSEDLFFLKTRLDEFPVADLSEECLFLIQDPLTLEWCNAPLSDIKEWLQQVIIHEDVHVWDGPWEDYSVGVAGYALAASLGKDLCDRIEALEEAPAYQLPIATVTRLGGIKVGSGLAITQDGVLSAVDVCYFEQDPDYSGEAHLKSAYAGLRIPGLRFGAGREAFDLEVRNVAAEGETPVYALYTPLPLVTNGIKIGDATLTWVPGAAGAPGHLHIDQALVTEGDQIVIDGEPGDGGTGGVSWLSELMDVKKNLAPSVNDILVWRSNVSRNDGTTAPGWTNMTKSTFLSGYATQTWVTGQINDILSSVLKFQGTTTTAISDGSTTNPITIDGASYTAQKGDVVLYNGKEYLWQGSSWEQLGDESSWALKTTTISAGTGLAGGGSLSSNRTIRLSDASIASLGHADDAYSYFTNGVANSAARLSGNTAYSVWGVEFWSNGVPKSATAQPNLYVGNTKVATSAQTAMNIGGLGILTLANGKAIDFLNNPAKGETAVAWSVLQLAATNRLLIGFDSSTGGGETYLYGSTIYFRYGTGHNNGLILDSTALTSYRDVIPNSNGTRNLGSASAMWKYTYTNRVYLTSSVYLEYVDNSGNGYVHINAPLVTDGDQIVVSGTPGGGGGGGVQWLYELQDVDPTLSSPTGGMVLQYDATSHLWKGAASDTIGITTAGTVAELNAANPTTAKRVWTPAVLAAWLSGKNYITGADAVSNVAVGGTGHTDELAVTKDGSTSYLTVPYANTVKRFKRYAGTDEVGGYDLNTLLSGGGITSQYNASPYWGNRPDSMSYGGVLQLNPYVSNTLAMQLAWDVVHQATQGNYGTGKLWWRDATYHDGAADWGAWHIIYDNTTLLLNGAAGTDTPLTFFAPTTAGTSGQLLKSGGANTAPAWTSSALGSATKHVYLNDSGVLTEGSAYAGGTKVTLNGTDKGATTAAFFAPTGAGTAGQVLLSGGAGVAPAWSSAALGAANKPVYIDASGVLTEGSACVTLAGAQTITGAKTHSANITLNNAVGLYCKDTNDNSVEALCMSSSDTLRIGYGNRTTGRTGIYGKTLNIAAYSTASGPNIYIGGIGTTHNIDAANVYFHSLITSTGIRNGVKVSAEHVANADRLNLSVYTSNNTTSPYAPSWNKTLEVTYDGKVNIGAPSFSDGVLNVNGAIVSAGDQIIVSDERIKRNFKAIELSVEQIASCRAVSFDWTTGGHSFGSIAQDWLNILPEAVHDGKTLSLAYAQLGTVIGITLAKHETEQDKEIRQLRTRVADLENEVKRLRTS